MGLTALVNYQEIVEKKQEQQYNFIKTFKPRNNVEEKFLTFFMSEYAKTKQSLNVVADMLEIQLDNASKNDKLHLTDIRAFNMKLKGKTAIVIAYGASLRLDLEHLKKIKDKYSLIAVDRACEYLRSHGIKPQYYVCVDSRSKSEWLGDYEYDNCVLFAFSGASNEFCHRFVELGGKVCFFVNPCRANTHLSIFQEIGHEYPIIPISGNVGQSALVIADFLLDCKKILLLGFDFGYNEWYYPDRYTEQSTDQLQPFTRTKTDIIGQQLITNDEFLSYILYTKEWIYERKIQDKVINCSSYGLLDIKLDKIINY